MTSDQHHSDQHHEEALHQHPDRDGSIARILEHLAAGDLAGAETLARRLHGRWGTGSDWSTELADALGHLECAGREARAAERALHQIADDLAELTIPPATSAP